MVAALAATAATASDASAQWTPPFDVSAPFGVAERPQVAVAPSGVATVVWTRYEDPDVAVHARRIDPSGAAGPILDVSHGEEALNAEVAVDAAGNATVVWTGHEGSQAVARSRRITAAGALEDVKTLSAPGETGFSPHVGIDGAGDATVAWTRYENPDFRVQWRRIDASGTLGPIQDLTPDSPANMDIDLAVDAAGNAVVVWPWWGGTETVVQWRRIDAAGTAGPIEDLLAAGASAFDPQVAIDGAGVPVAVWYRDDGTVQARRGLGRHRRPVRSGLQRPRRGRRRARRCHDRVGALRRRDRPDGCAGSPPTAAWSRSGTCGPAATTSTRAWPSTSTATRPPCGFTRKATTRSSASARRRRTGSSDRPSI